MSLNFKQQTTVVILAKPESPYWPLLVLRFLQDEERNTQRQKQRKIQRDDYQVCSGFAMTKADRVILAQPESLYRRLFVLGLLEREENKNIQQQEQRNTEILAPPE